MEGLCDILLAFIALFSVMIDNQMTKFQVGEVLFLFARIFICMRIYLIWNALQLQMNY